MKRLVIPSLTVAFLLILSLQGIAQTPGKTYAQELVDRALAKHKEVLTIAMHVTPPNSPDNVIIASNFGRIGKKADEDDLTVIKTGQPKMEVGKTGDRFGVELPLLDANARTIGALAVAFPYKAGDNKAEFLKAAQRVQTELGRRISHVANLVEPAQVYGDLDPTGILHPGEAMVVEPGVRSGMPILYDRPAEVGADRMPMQPPDREANP